MLRKLLIATVMLGAASPAYAHNWWILNQAKAECDNANIVAAQNGLTSLTPEAMADAFRSKGDAVFSKEFRDNNENLMAISLTISPTDGSPATTEVFFTAPTFCENFLSHLKANGAIADPNDMN